VHAVRQAFRAQIAERLGAALHDAYAANDDAGPYSVDGVAIGRRALKNVCLSYLSTTEAGVKLAAAQFDAARNMTDMLAALASLAATDTAERDRALGEFHARWRHDALVLDKWFAIQAASPRPDTLDVVRALYRSPDFELRNPNRARALLGGFATNQVRFHDASGAGYGFFADAVIALDALNGQTAARLVSPLGQWRRQDASRAAKMRGELERIRATSGLSRFTWEKVTKSLHDEGEETTEKAG
jgi:aminopeptidase N